MSSRQLVTRALIGEFELPVAIRSEVMRLTSWILLFLGLTVAVLMVVWPTSLHAAGTSLDCGAPIIRVFRHRASTDIESDGIAALCRAQSERRITVGVAVGGALVTAGCIALGLSRRQGPRHSEQ